MILRVLLASRSRDLLEDTRGAFGDEDVLLANASDAEEMWEALRSKPFDLLVVDRAFLGRDAAIDFEGIEQLPDAPETIVLSQDDDAEKHAELLDAGALACVGTDLERHTLYRTVRALLRRAKRQAVAEFMAGELAVDSRLSDFASKSPSMQGFLGTVRKVVGTSSSLLILGETGVGKEYLARAIHLEGPRGDKPFVAVNCAALPETLLESELFGHVAGAFTGAERARRGYFELGHPGTVFLDEIGELPLHLQVKILRVLQERTVQPVGAEKTIEVDVRVIAATNRDLKVEMEAKRFRADLYYRLGVVTLTVPPLRQRREDIPDLVLNHIEHFRTMLGRPVFGIQPEAMDRLVCYSWPGNVRELINVIERAVLLADAEEVAVGDLPEDVQDPRHFSGGIDEIPTGRGGEIASLTRRPLHEAREALVESFERRYLDELLRETRGRIGQAATRAGLTPRSLYEKMKRLGLRKESYKESARRSG